MNTSHDEERFITFLNALPMSDSPRGFIDAFREALQSFLMDVDRISVNINFTPSLIGDPDADTSYVVQVLNQNSEVEAMSAGLQKDGTIHSERILEKMKGFGFPFSNYHPPHSYDYMDRGGILVQCFCGD